MGSGDDFDGMADAIIAAAEKVNQAGSPTLQQAMRAVLYILGRELAGQHAQLPEGTGESIIPELAARNINKRSN